MTLYAGIDLHSSSSYLGVIDESNVRVFGRKVPNSLEEILRRLEPFKEDLVGTVVESTYNWYWLVDGLEEQGYKVHLANPSAIHQYEGLKYTDDKWDSYWLAHLLRLGILPEGYIYPKEERPTRDLMRRRLMFVHQRTSQILSLQSMITRNLGDKISGNKIKQLREGDVERMFAHPRLRSSACHSIAIIEFMSGQIVSIEREIRDDIKLRDGFAYLQTVPGIGKILGYTIMLEVGEIGRFEKVGNYSSYCRCVRSERRSGGKKKGEGNQKNGNRYLAWAYVEAAHFAIRHSKRCQRFYQRKKSEKNGAVATKALANKLARASYYVMRDRVPYDERKLFAN